MCAAPGFERLQLCDGNSLKSAQTQSHQKVLLLPHASLQAAREVYDSRAMTALSPFWTP